VLRLDGCCLEQKVGYGRDAAPKPREPGPLDGSCSFFGDAGVSCLKFLLTYPLFDDGFPVGLVLGDFSGLWFRIAVSGDRGSSAAGGDLFGESYAV